MSAHPVGVNQAAKGAAQNQSIEARQNPDDRAGVLLYEALHGAPLLVLVSIQNSNALAAMIPKSKVFAVSILADDQEAVSNAFSKSGREPGATLGADVPTLAWHTGSPIVAGAIAHLDCHLETAIPGGDHTIVVGRVVGASFDTAKEPLIYFRRRYRKLAE
ncbi:MAG: flavin reductase family protein [Anaerolineaceae bacterium]